MIDVTCIGILIADLIAGPLRNYPEKSKMVMVDSMQLSTGEYSSRIKNARIIIINNL